MTVKPCPPFRAWQSLRSPMRSFQHQALLQKERELNLPGSVFYPAGVLGSVQQYLRRVLPRLAFLDVSRSIKDEGANVRERLELRAALHPDRPPQFRGPAHTSCILATN